MKKYHLLREKPRLYLKILFFTIYFISNGIRGFGNTSVNRTDSLLNLNCVDMPIEEVLRKLKQKTSVDFIYKHEDIKHIPPITKEFKNETLKNILAYCLKNTDYTYSITNNVVVIKKRSQQKPIEKISVKGSIKNSKGEPLQGATVILKGSIYGCPADKDGNFFLEFPKAPEMELMFEYMGMQPQTIKIVNSAVLHIVMQQTEIELEDVIVTSYYTRSKNEFTGSLTTIKGEDLIKVSPTNFFQALSVLTPGLRIIPNNETGANPNAVPEIIIRGTTSIITEEQKDVNTPLIILDGSEISIEELYDIDIFDIERVDVLKDASATVLYGERASNGVILIERTRIKEAKARVKYNFVPNFSFPDLRSLRLCNAEEKLELERIAGLYNTVDGSLDPAYALKLENVRRGVNTDWPSKPLRTAFTHTHSIHITGKGGGLDYKASGRFSDIYGVMKGDYRKVYGTNFKLGYHPSKSLTLNYNFSFSMTENKLSPYGRFSQYTKLNPYESIYDAEGKFIKNFYFNPLKKEGFNLSNPLYDATLSSFSKARNKSIKNNMNMRWNINESFFITGQFNISLTDRSNSAYTSPAASEFSSEFRPEKKGRYKITDGDGWAWDGKLVLNYNKRFDTKGTVFSITGGSEISKNKSSKVITVAEGFLKDGMTDIKFASRYSDIHPMGGDAISTSVGFFVNTNFILLNRYFIDGSYKTSGSSKFGSSNRFTPLYATGIGWNLHNESFMKYPWINTLRLRFSTGYTANVTFNPYQAMTTYNYTPEYIYYSGIGAVPITMGNPDLKWQKTVNYDYGIITSLFQHRLNFEFSYWKQNTSDALMPIDLPWSVGVSDVKVNMGKISNSGYEFSISAQIVKDKFWFWTLRFNGQHSFDKLSNISDALKATNAAIYYGAKPQPLYVEGGSQYAIYGVRSAGIDPMTGKELFITKNGKYTFDYNSDDRVELGNTNPKLSGGINTSLNYKGISLNLTMTYTFGSDIYNTTLANKVENIDPRTNVDRRAFTLRWKQPGDIVPYLGIPESVDHTSRFTERFVQKNNEIFLSNISVNYEFSHRTLQKWGIRKFNIGFGMSDIGRISTVKFERGTEYPYQRSFNFTLRPTF